MLDKLLNQELNKTNDFLEKLREKSKQLDSILKNNSTYVGNFIDQNRFSEACETLELLEFTILELQLIVKLIEDVGCLVSIIEAVCDNYYLKDQIKLHHLFSSTLNNETFKIEAMESFEELKALKRKIRKLFYDLKNAGVLNSLY